MFMPPLPPPRRPGQVDIWAAGVMLCVMLIGRFPFEGTEMSHVTNLDDVSEHVSHSAGRRGGWGGVLGYDRLPRAAGAWMTSAST